jgi:hypothetical protein
MSSFFASMNLAASGKCRRPLSDQNIPESPWESNKLEGWSLSCAALPLTSAVRLCLTVPF